MNYTEFLEYCIENNIVLTEDQVNNFKNKMSEDDKKKIVKQVVDIFKQFLTDKGIKVTCMPDSKEFRTGRSNIIKIAITEPIFKSALKAGLKGALLGGMAGADLQNRADEKKMQTETIKYMKRALDSKGRQELNSKLSRISRGTTIEFKSIGLDKNPSVAVAKFIVK